jgi:tungstate transport system permease protein
MNLFWEEIKAAVPLIFHGNPYLFSVIGFTLQVAAIATVVATVLGVPIGLAIGLGHFRGRGALQILANASLGLPPVLVGLFLFLVFVPQAPLGGLQYNTTRNGVYVAQAILAMPYTVALTAAAVQGLPPGLLEQARRLGAGHARLATLALREARIGVVAAVLAALGTALSEVAAIAIVGGNVYGYDQTLASATLYEANQARYSDATAIAIVLLALIVILMGSVSLLQHTGGGIRMRFRGRPATTTRPATTAATPG